MNAAPLSALVLTLALVAPIHGQEEVRTASGTGEFVLTLWTPPDRPEATVLLLPGWGGGPFDQLGIGRALSAAGIAVAVLTPRGWHHATGTATFANALDDIGTAFDWLGASRRPDLSSGRLVIGGHSWGGGMALAFAASHEGVETVFSIAGTDHGQFIRQYEADPAFAEMVDALLGSSAAPDGPIRFSVRGTLDELAAGQQMYGLMENAGALADRRVLLVGGWQDVNVTVDDTLLPLYRALREAGARDVRFETFDADHGFDAVRGELHAALSEWIKG